MDKYFYFLIYLVPCILTCSDMEVKQAHRYSQITLEEHILIKHYGDLHQGITDPLRMATQLVQSEVIDSALVSKLMTSNMSCSQQNATILSAVNSSVHDDPSHFQVLLRVLGDTAESATLAKKMRTEFIELSELTIMFMRTKHALLCIKVL